MHYFYFILKVLAMLGIISILYISEVTSPSAFEKNRYYALTSSHFILSRCFLKRSSWLVRGKLCLSPWMMISGNGGFVGDLTDTGETEKWCIRCRLDNLWHAVDDWLASVCVMFQYGMWNSVCLHGCSRTSLQIVGWESERTPIS